MIWCMKYISLRSLYVNCICINCIVYDYDIHSIVWNTVSFWELCAKWYYVKSFNVNLSWTLLSNCTEMYAWFFLVFNMKWVNLFHYNLWYLIIIFSNDTVQLKNKIMLMHSFLVHLGYLYDLIIIILVVSFINF